MRGVWPLTLALIAGSLLGFFGVLLSVFGDASSGERLAFVLLIVAIYCLLGGLWGFLSPGRSWRWGLILSAPGVLLLAVYTLREPNPGYLAYILALLALPSLCAGVGAGFAARREHRVGPQSRPSE